MKAIVSDKLYDTKTSEVIFEQQPYEILYRTDKGVFNFEGGLNTKTCFDK